MPDVIRSMRSLRRLTLASASTLAIATAAQAEPVHNWTGFYVGLNAGYAWGRSDARTSVLCDTPNAMGGYFCEPGDARTSAVVAGVGTGRMTGNGFAGGLQAGYNWQANAFVYGVEIDAGAFNIGASRASSVVSPGPMPGAGAVLNISNAIDTDWLFTARARAGWAVSDLLLYVTGGLAVTNLETTNTYVDVFPGFGPFATGRWESSETRLGWTLGGGVEWAVGRAWSVKLEYLYLDFGSVSAFNRIGTNVGYAQGISTSADLTAHIARAGVNFRF